MHQKLDNKELVIMNMSDVYKEEDFYKRSGECLQSDVHLDIVDESKVEGTDCYCDELAEKQIRNGIGRLSEESIHFIDSGNYHYISKFWMEKIRYPFELLLFDNHPDMQPALFGPILSCGSWVRDSLADNRFLKHVETIGVNQKLLDDEIRRYGDKVSFLSWQQLYQDLHMKRKEQGKIPVETLSHECTFLAKDYPYADLPVYLSIDKDVISEQEVETNWDQGKMPVDVLFSLLKCVFTHRQVIGMDICGECDPVSEKGDVRSAIQTNNAVNKRFMHFINNLEKK